MPFKLTSLAALTLAAGSLMASEPESIVQENKSTVTSILQNGNKTVDKAAEESARITSKRGSDYKDWVVYHTKTKGSGRTKVKYLYRMRAAGDVGEATGKPKGVKIEFDGEKGSGVVVLRWELRPGNYSIEFSKGNINRVWVRLTDKEGQDIDEGGNKGRVGFKSWSTFTIKIPENSKGDVELFLFESDDMGLVRDPDFKNELFFEELKVVPLGE